MEFIIILFVVLYILSLVWNIFTDNKDERFLSAFLLTISGIICIELLASYENRNTPTSLDVYQGKTTLEITYRDSIPIDTVVVFKSEFKK
jgi:hypothetical protein